MLRISKTITALFLSCLTPYSATAEEILTSDSWATPQAIPQDSDNPKSLVVDFHVTANKVTILRTRLLPGRARTYINEPDMFRYQLKGFTGEDLARINSSDPRGIRIYLPPVNGQESGEEYIIRPEADSTIIVPFISNLSSIEFKDNQNRDFGIEYVARDIKTFCQQQVQDQDCAQWLTDLREDVTSPEISCSMSDGTWHSDDVVLNCQATDLGSGLATIADASFTLATNVAVGYETDNASSTSRSICDVAENCAAAGPINGNKIDKKPPAISVSQPVSEASYILKQNIIAAYACTDAGSGVAKCIGTVDPGVVIDTSSVGAKTFAVTTNDNVGNADSINIDYYVKYDFKGFFQPIENSPTINSVKANSAIPVKFSLSGNQGLNIMAAGYPLSQRVPCDATSPVSDIEETVSSGFSSLTYDALSDQYNYIWKTDKAWAQTCRELTVKLNDNTEHKAKFKFK